MPEESNDQELAKARVFFERARSFAAKGNVEHAIDMYLEGLQHAPDALEEGHLPLAELGLTRQTKGGKKLDLRKFCAACGKHTPHKSRRVD